MSSRLPHSDPIPPNRERALAMVLAAIVAALAITAVLVFKHDADEHKPRSHAQVLRIAASPRAASVGRLSAR
jgi:hypothetical protein